MSLYKTCLRPLLFRLPPEAVHHAALRLLSSPAARLLGGGAYPGPERKLWGLTFPNPLGLAAGFDKNGVALDGWEALGFGFMELGTVTPLPQPGNPKPRIFRLPGHGGLINRMGFPNEGAAALADRLRARKETGRWPSVPVGINLGKGKATPLEEAPADYLACFRALRELGDYFVVNVSSPNTPDLRRLQDGAALARILDALQAENAQGTPKPILVKIAPDLTDEALAEAVAVLRQHGGAGIVATNTTLDKSAVPLKEAGGLSGAPLRRRSTEVIRFLARETGGALPIIGAGGIFTAQDAREKLEAGASLLQAYTGLIYEGPGFVRAVCAGLRG
ncbi:MAG: quinone-dependent dihydroorotate dehydrogenase [Verrucomicrobium sp.]|nr:quinone-dependent dihydroorotate dehydrogenase [Verrucomicrobium sp.]